MATHDMKADDVHLRGEEKASALQAYDTSAFKQDSADEKSDTEATIEPVIVGKVRMQLAMVLEGRRETLLLASRMWYAAMFFITGFESNRSVLESVSSLYV